MIGIVILNYQLWDLSLRCMESIEHTEQGTDYRIYLVDNGSSNPMPDAVRIYIQEKHVCFIQAEANRGYAAGNNLGIKKALWDACQVLVITNNDIVFQERTISKMADCLKNNPSIGIVGPKVVDRQGIVQVSRCSMRTGMKEIIQVSTIVKKIFRKKCRAYYCLDKSPDMAETVYHVSGCCFGMSSECAKAVTPLDEGTILYDEELILGIRMEEAGYRTYYEPACVVEHLHGTTTRRIQPFMFQCVSQSELYYCSKYLHAKRWQLWMLKEYRMFLYWLRSLRYKELREYKQTYKENISRTWQDVRRKS